MPEQDNSIKKLFAVEVMYKAYVFVDDASDVDELIDEIIETERPDFVDTRKVDKNVLGWPTHALVYTDSGEEIDLHTALEIVSNKE